VESDLETARHHWKEALTLFDGLGRREAREIRDRLAALVTRADGRTP
jgi:hypothetical protein